MIRENEAFSQNPIQLICDNMIIVWDNVPGNPGVIWDDDNECCYWLHPNAANNRSGDVQDAYPFKVKVVPYDMIQYIDILLPPTDAHEYIKEHKDEMTGTEEQLNKMYADAIGHRSYTGTISNYPHREIGKPLNK